MAIVEIQVPDIGDFDEVTVIELLVKPGDTIKADQSLLTVESDKASMEIPSSSAGIVKELKVQLGDKVKQGSVVLLLEAEGSAAAASPVSEPNTAPAPVSSAQSAIDSGAAKAAEPAAAQAAPAPASSGPVAIEIRVPDIGDFKDVTVIEVLVKVGDSIKVEQSLVTVESDKASMEIPSSSAGVLKDLRVKLGDKINIGDVLAMLEGSAPAPASAPVAAAAAAVSSPAPAPSAPASASAAQAASPASATA